MSNHSLAFVDLVLRGTPKRHAQSTFLAYADATLVVTDSAGDEALRMRFRSVELKVLNGRFRIDFKSERGSDGSWYPTVFPKTAATRKDLTAAMLAAYREVLAQRKRSASA